MWKNMCLVSSQSRTSPLVSAATQLTLFPSPTTCAVDDFRLLIFGNSHSPDKLTGNPKSQINIYLYIVHHLPIYEVNGASQYQGHISTKGFDLPPIMTQSSPFCYSKRRTTFRKWRPKKIWRRRNILSWGVASLILLCNSKRRMKLVNWCINNR